jgi:hypothetical protein
LGCISFGEVHQIHIVGELDDLTHISIELRESCYIGEHILLGTNLKISSLYLSLDVHGIALHEEFVLVTSLVDERDNPIHECWSDDHATCHLIFTFYIKEFLELNIFELDSIFGLSLVLEKVRTPSGYSSCYDPNNQHLGKPKPEYEYNQSYKYREP